MGEPRKLKPYTPELAATICERLAVGESLRSICKGPDMPSAALVRQWVVDDVQGFAALYARARDAGLDYLADETLEISDDGTNDWMERERERGGVETVANHEHINRSRLRVDTRKWYLSKLAPKRYGEKITAEITGPDGGPVQITDAERTRRMEALLAAVRKRQGDELTDADLVGDGEPGADLV